MQCAAHAAPALGVCRACGAALCDACRASDIFGMVCRGECERRARVLDRIVAQSAATNATANKSFRSAALLCWVAAVLSLAGVLWAVSVDIPVLLWTFAGASLIFLVGGLGLSRVRFPEDDDAA